MIATISEMAKKRLEGMTYTTCHDDTDHEWPLFERYSWIERTMLAKGVPEGHPMLALAYIGCINIDEVDDKLEFVDPWDSEKKVQNAKSYLVRCRAIQKRINEAESDDEKYQLFAENPDVFVEWLIAFSNECNEYKPGFDEETYDDFEKCQDRMIEMRDEVLKRLSKGYDDYRRVISAVERSQY